MGALPPVTLADREARRAVAVRRSVVADRTVRRAAVAGAAWLLAYAAASAALPAGTLASEILGGFVYLVPWSFAAVLSVRAARGATGTARVLWRLIAASNVLWLCGEITWAVIEVVLQRDPFPSVADGFYLAGLTLLLPAVVTAFRARGPGRRRAHLDASTMALVVAYGGYTLLIAPHVTGGPTLATVVSAAYPTLGIAVLMLLCDRMLVGRRVPVSTLLVTAAVLAGVPANAGFSYLVATDGYATGDVLELGWQLQAILFALGALVARRFDEEHHDDEPARRDPGLVLMLGGLVACFAMVVAYDDVGSLVLLGWAISAVILRLWLSSRERAQLAEALRRALGAEEQRALADPLTGLHNRRFFEAVLERELDRARRSDTPVGLLMVDLDHFKAVNDVHGHLAGDAVLREAARRLAAAVRSEDLVARLGGEEFVAVLPGADEVAVQDVAERCRAALADEAFTVDGAPPLAVTASVGGAVWPHGGTGADALTATADGALYAAKRLGRDRVVLAAV